MYSTGSEWQYDVCVGNLVSLLSVGGGGAWEEIDVLILVDKKLSGWICSNPGRRPCFID